MRFNPQGLLSLYVERNDDKRHVRLVGRAKRQPVDVQWQPMKQRHNAHQYARCVFNPYQKSGSHPALIFLVYTNASVIDRGSKRLHRAGYFSSCLSAKTERPSSLGGDDGLSAKTVLCRPSSPAGDNADNSCGRNQIDGERRGLYRGTKRDLNPVSTETKERNPEMIASQHSQADLNITAAFRKKINFIYLVFFQTRPARSTNRLKSFVVTYSARRYSMAFFKRGQLARSGRLACP